RGLAGRNADCDRLTCFLGAGAYDHFVPSTVPHLALKPEFLTAYTPYQAELMQGELQALWEYQSLMCELTAMDVANASMYDGASATGEAAHMAADLTRRTRVLVSTAVHPEYRQVLRTYTSHLRIAVEDLPAQNGVTPPEAAERALGDDVAALIIQSPNFFGRLAGRTVETKGRPGYVLRLQTREHHIRRAKAPSNICTDASLNARIAAVYLSSLGRRGMQDVAELNARETHYARERIAALPGD